LWHWFHPKFQLQIVERIRVREGQDIDDNIGWQMLAMVIHADARPSPQSASGLQLPGRFFYNTMQRAGAIS